jgi:hypothetical protein
MIETKYDEGFRGDDAIESSVTMLTQYVGFASLINRFNRITELVFLEPT